MDDAPFGRLVRSHRERLLLTQEQLADRAGLSVRSVRAIESGAVRSPRARSVVLLSEGLGLTDAEREAFEATARGATSTLPTAAAPPSASLLPPDLPDFTGRDALVRILGELLPDGARASEAVVVSALAGRAGIGKTTLAVHVAHRLRSRFPDGQLYVNLRGAHADPLDPSAVLARFLRALGQDGAVIPPGLEERAERYRALLADREVLVLLDDAGSEAQVRPLLPGSPSCAVLVTSRGRLSALEGAHLVELDVLQRAQAVDLLGRIVGEARVRAEPESAVAIVERCGLLPLAVRIAGAKLAARPHWSLGRLERLLADERRRLDELTAGDLEVRASVALSYEALTGEERAAFRRLAMLQAPDFAGWVAAAMLDVGVGQGEQVVERLVQAQLLDPAGNGADGQPRYRFHDLLRVYARERARLEEPAHQRDAALARAFGAWLALAELADQRLPNGSGVIRHGHAPRWRLDAVTEAALLADPVAWLETERVALVAAVEQSAASAAVGSDELVWDLAVTLSSFFELRSYLDEWYATNALALAATRRTDNRRGQVSALVNLAESQFEWSRLDDASRLLDEALDLATAEGDEHTHAYIRFELSVMARYHGRPAAALPHAEAAVEMFTRLADHRRLSYALYERGTARLQLGHFVQAEADLSASLELNRGLDLRAHVQVLRRLALLHLERGGLDRARGLLQGCLEGCRTLQDALGEAYTLESLSQVEIEQGRFAVARTLLERAHSEFERMGILRGQGLALRTMGALHAAQGRTGQAHGCLRRALGIWRQLDVPTELDRTERYFSAIARL